MGPAGPRRLAGPYANANAAAATAAAVPVDPYGGDHGASGNPALRPAGGGGNPACRRRLRWRWWLWRRGRASGILPDSICTYIKSGDMYVCITTDYTIIYVYTYTVHIRTYIRICTYCTYMHVFSCTFQRHYRYTCIYIHIRSYVHICTCEFTYRYVHMNKYEHTNRYVYLCIYVYVSLRTDTFI